VARGPSDRATEEPLVTAQIGRAPRGPWRVAVRCSYGRPQVIASPSRLADGAPFPTTFWLTCPYLIDLVSAEESAGGTDAWAARLAAEPDLAAAMEHADAAYRAARTSESGGEDACAGTGTAGMRRPLGVKCLHAHVAALLAGIDDPVGAGVLGQRARVCDDDRCATLAAGKEALT
jgi:uncharacterized protein